MEILVVNWQDIKNPNGGGAEVHIHEIFSRLVKKGHSVRLVCSNFPGGKRNDEIDGIKIIRRGERNTFNWIAPIVVRNEIRKKRPNIIVEDINKVPFFLPLYTSRIPVLVIVPHLFGETAFNEATFLGASYVYLMERPIPKIHGNCRFVVISESTKRDLIERGIPGEKISVSFCGIDHEKYFPDFERKSKVPLIVYAGRIRKYKNVEDAILAMRNVVLKFPSAKLIIIGEGDYLSSLKKSVRELKLENVEFLGYLPMVELVRLLQSAWVVVNTSRKEGWGLTAVEASACGTPVVAYDVPGLRDSVCNERSGFLVKFGHVEGLSIKIIQILQDESLRKQMSQQAVEWTSQFSWDKAAMEMEKELLKTVVNQESMLKKTHS